MAKKRPDDMTAEEFLTQPNKDLEHGLRCVLYEMLVLALALVQLRDKGPPFQDLQFGLEQTADTAALLKARVLIDFLSPASFPHEVQAFHASANKWTAHLTWQRVHRQGKHPQPFPADILSCGMFVLDRCDDFVTRCRLHHGYAVSSRNATGYLEKFKELYADLKNGVQR